MKIRNDLTDEEIKLYMMSVAATITKQDYYSLTMEIPHNGRIGVIKVELNVKD